MAKVDHNWDDGVSSQHGEEEFGISKETYERGVRQDWTREEVESLYGLSFNKLIFRAQSVHRQHFNPDQVQLSRLLSIKTGGCPADCAYCPQSARYQTDVLAGSSLQQTLFLPRRSGRRTVVLRVFVWALLGVVLKTETSTN